MKLSTIVSNVSKIEKINDKPKLFLFDMFPIRANNNSVENTIDWICDEMDEKENCKENYCVISNDLNFSNCGNLLQQFETVFLQMAMTMNIDSNDNNDSKCH